jgi:hypothetical protein
VSIGPSNLPATGGRVGRHPSHLRAFRRLQTFAIRRLAALVLTIVAGATVMTPVVGAESQTPATEAGPLAQRSDVTAPRIVAQQDTKDAYDGGYLPTVREIVFPSIELGLTPERPIPIGVTCSCTIDRVGLISQFDITVLQVVQDAYPMVQQLNRFNRPPRPGARYVAAYVGQQYVAGPENQAYTSTESDWKSTANDGRLSDTAQLLHTEIEYRPRADVYPNNYVNGWLIYELPINRPAFLVWKYNFVGERGIWFALQ